MEKISKKLSKKIMAVILALAMAVGVTAGVKVVLDSSFADELGKFDPVFYAAAYPDVAAALGTDAEVLYSHYQNYGQKEGRVPYAGAAAGETVDGIAGTTAVPAPAVNPAIDPAAVPGRDLSDWTPEQLAMLAQKQAEFDASDFAKVGWTEQQVYERLMWIKENLYPEGTKVGTCGSGAGAITNALYGGIPLDWMVKYENAYGGYDVVLDKAGESVLPVGYVEYKTYRRYSGGNIRDIRVGDKLYTYGAGTGHVSVVLSHDERGITVVESNIGDDKKMHWGRFISWDELENGGKADHNWWQKFDSYKY